MLRLSSFLIVVLSMLCSSISATRPKRIMWGDRFDRMNTGFDAVHYNVWMGYGVGCDERNFFRLNELTVNCTIVPEKLWCGGTLITPNIVQTAAHCLSTPYKVKVDPVFLVGRPRNKWENLLRCFVGAYNVTTFTPGFFEALKHNFGAFTKKFILHERFGQSEKHKHLITHDYGWAILSKDIAASNVFPGLPWKLAPVFSKKDLAEFYNQVLNLQYACLIIGYGQPNDKYAHSQILRYGWVMATPYFECARYVVNKWLLETKYETYEGYRDVGTWVCLPTFGANKQFAREADSGSPITCNNLPFATIQSYSAYDMVRDPSKTGDSLKVRDSANHTLTFGAALAFAIFQQTVEYRREFIQAVVFYVEDSNYPTFRPTFFIPSTVQFAQEESSKQSKLFFSVLTLFPLWMIHFF